MKTATNLENHRAMDSSVNSSEGDPTETPGTEREQPGVQIRYVLISPGPQRRRLYPQDPGLDGGPNPQAGALGDRRRRLD